MIMNIKTVWCHGIPERCFRYKGKHLPFCARCLGVSIGHVLSFALLLFDKLPAATLSVGFVAVMGIDWSLQKWAGIPSTNTRRLITGVLGGFGVGAMIWQGVKLGYTFIH